MRRKLSPKALEYLKSLDPVLDTQGKFVFIPHNKCAQRSVCRSTLRKRAVVRKDNERVYLDLLNEYAWEDAWEDAFRFTIVRNPFERVVSAFFYLQKHELIATHLPFKDFVRKHNVIDYDIHFTPMAHRVFYSSESLVHTTARLESLERDWAYIAEKIDAPEMLAHINKTNHDHYSKYYETSDIVDTIRDLYEDDIVIFNYRFDEKFVLDKGIDDD